MVTKTKKWKSTGSKKRFIGKPAGQIQERVQAVGPERFGIIAVDCAKRRSKWMLCDFYGKVIIEPTSVEHTAGGLRVMTQLVTFCNVRARPCGVLYCENRWTTEYSVDSEPDKAQRI